MAFAVFLGSQSIPRTPQSYFRSFLFCLVVLLIDWKRCGMRLEYVMNCMAWTTAATGFPCVAVRKRRVAPERKGFVYSYMFHLVPSSGCAADL